MDLHSIGTPSPAQQRTPHRGGGRQAWPAPGRRQGDVGTPGSARASRRHSFQDPLQGPESTDEWLALAQKGKEDKETPKAVEKAMAEHIMQDLRKVADRLEEDSWMYDKVPFEK